VGNDPTNRIDSTGKGDVYPQQRAEVDPLGIVDLFIGDFVEAARNPTTKNITIAAIDIIPAGRMVRFGSRLLRSEHFIKHGAEFASKSASQYERAASRFMSGRPARGTMEAVRKNGDIIRYNPKTEEFAVMRKDGTIRTYFKPDPKIHGLKTNEDYFRREVAK
jgi:hypothetical protein